MQSVAPSLAQPHKSRQRTKGQQPFLKVGIYASPSYQGSRSMIFPKPRGLTRRKREPPASENTTNNDHNAESAPLPTPNSDENSTPPTEEASWDGLFPLFAPNKAFGTPLWRNSGVCDVCGNLSADELPGFFTHGACDVSAYRGCAACKLLWKVCEPYLEEMAKVRLNSITVSLFEGTLLVSFERLGREVRVYAVEGISIHSETRCYDVGVLCLD